VTRIGELETTLAETISQVVVTLVREALHSSETSVLTRATRRNSPENTFSLQNLRLLNAEKAVFTQNISVMTNVFTDVT
jgi:hypothetical protein